MHKKKKWTWSRLVEAIENCSHPFISKLDLEDYDEEHRRWNITYFQINEESLGATIAKCSRAKADKVLEDINQTLNSLSQPLYPGEIDDAVTSAIERNGCYLCYSIK